MPVNFASGHLCKSAWLLFPGPQPISSIDFGEKTMLILPIKSIEG